MSEQIPAIARTAEKATEEWGTASPWVVYPTALLEGICVMIIEIAGARALAPFFGTSLRVWTAQITVTLLFLAAGYGLGGLLARNIRRATLACLFAIAGAWLALYPLLRAPVLDWTSQQFGVALGSLLSAAILFGIPLLMLGSVSPVLIAYIDARRPGAGSAAGRLFFTNTMGGLAGGWITAFVLVPYSSLRLALVATGILLLLLACAWAMLGRSGATPVIAVLLIAAVGVFVFHKPPRTFRDKHGNALDLRYSRQSGIGLLQVFDTAMSRVLLINGVVQGQMDTGTGESRNDYIRSLHLLTYSHHAAPHTALQLGLGAGLLPRQLAKEGFRVTAVEIEPRMPELAREFFELPDSVQVHIADARAFLRHDASTYDLIFLDTFASESTPWHMLTREAFEEMKERLNPGGRLLINTVAYAGATGRADGAGPARVEATLRAVFPDVLVYPEPPQTSDTDELINVTIVAGEKLDAAMRLPPGGSADADRQNLFELLKHARHGASGGAICTDDRSDLDYLEAPMRARWRSLIWLSAGSNFLGD